MRCAAFAILTTLLGAAGAQAAWALPKTLGTQDQCYCACDSASGSEVNLYDSKGINCVAFNGATCNRENKSTGTIETGKLTGCSTRLTWELRTQGAVSQQSKSKMLLKAPQ